MSDIKATIFTREAVQQPAIVIPEDAAEIQEFSQYSCEAANALNARIEAEVAKKRAAIAAKKSAAVSA